MTTDDAEARIAASMLGSARRFTPWTGIDERLVAGLCALHREQRAMMDELRRELLAALDERLITPPDDQHREAMVERFAPSAGATWSMRSLCHEQARSAFRAGWNAAIAACRERAP